MRGQSKALERKTTSTSKSVIRLVISMAAASLTSELQEGRED